MKHLFLFFVIFLFPIQTTFAQNRRGLIGTNNNIGSLTFTIGPSYLFGDLGGSVKENPTAFDNINLNNVRYEVSLGFRHSFNNRFGYRLSLHHGLYESADAGLRNEARGYASTSNITMFTVLGEIDIFQSRAAIRSRGAGATVAVRPWRIYAYGGGGGAYASIDLTGNSTAGNPRATSKTSESTPIIPFGLGFDIWTNSNFNIGLEIGWKYTFSDYMDGIRIRDSANDILGNISLTLSYRVFGGDNLRRNNCVWCK